MRNQKETFKNIGIGILAVIAVVLLIIVVFYNKISIGKLIPRVDSYELKDEIKNEIGDLETNENSEIVTTYELDASDLKAYEKTKQYNKGKKDPFAAQSSQSSSNGNSSSSNLNGDDSTEKENNPSSDNFYEDDGTK